jgi:hypothetical protein
MSINDGFGNDKRAVWERPALRRLNTEDAEQTGIFQSEGNPDGPQCVESPNQHSCKNLLPGSG